MGYYSDPTASRALGKINREFSRHEKRAKKLLELLDRGVISVEDIEAAQGQFTGIYRHVLTHAIIEKREKEKESE